MTSSQVDIKTKCECPNVWYGMPMRDYDWIPQQRLGMDKEMCRRCESFTATGKSKEGIALCKNCEKINNREEWEIMNA